MNKTIDEFFADATLIKTSVGRGGARPNTGPKRGHKSATSNTPEGELTDYQRLERAKADKEEQQARSAKVKADLDEGSVVYRDAVESAAAQAFAACSQSMDAIPDALERDGIDPDICIKVGEIINTAKMQLMKDLEKTYTQAKAEEAEADEND